MAADFGSPVVTPNQPTVAQRAVDTLGGILGLQQQKQALQIGQQELQQQQQTAKQRAGIANFFKDYKLADHVGEDGTIDLDDVLTNQQLRNAAGDQYPQVVGQLLGIKQNQLLAKQDLVKLNDTTRTQLQELLGGLRTDPDVIADNDSGRQKVQNAVDQFGKTGPDAARIAGIYGPNIQHVPRGNLAQALSNVQLQAMDAGKQAASQAPTYLDSGAKFQDINPQSAGGNLTQNANLAKGIPPGMVTFKDQAENTWAYNPQDPGHAILVGQGGSLKGGKAPTAAPTSSAQMGAGQQQGASTPTSAPPVMDVGEADVLKANTAKINQNRQAAQDAQTQRDILGRIQLLSSSPSLYTGPGSHRLGEVATAVAQIPGFEKAAQYANNYNELTKYMAQNAARMGAQMGLDGSDARLDLAIHSQPNAAMDPRTIQQVSQYMSALVRMHAAKADAMDRWLQFPGNNARNEQHFEQIWRDNADPRLFQLAEMKDQGDANNYAKLHIRSNERQELQAKQKVLQQLGALP